jgi:hypothetical protein
MEEFVVGRQKWFAMSTPPLQFEQVLKEAGTHGKLYLVCWERTRASSAFVGQSIPPLVEFICQKLTCRLYPSSLYRILRGENKNHKMKWMVYQFDREDLGLFNREMHKYDSIFFITKDPEKWIIRELIEYQNS